ncbi:MAG: NAD(P)H-binding protein [Bacteroidales bacterium]|jgi:uncharacterized protein YbjT (DUF2867 family)|nr:NAD(P)H-binding protein [Bacteroidales bacterium]
MTGKSHQTALIFGSTGLIGRFVLELLTRDARYDRIVIFVRKEIKTHHGKVSQVIFNPDNLETVADQIKGDQAFCCLGTTLKKAGSKEAFLDVDLRLVSAFATHASRNGVPVFSVVSSIGARSDSSNFYLNTKGLMEETLRKLQFEQLVILRPSLLLGIRPEGRWLEDLGKSFFKIFSVLMIGKLRKYKPVHAETVAKAMIWFSNERKNLIIAESDAIASIGSKNQ